MGGLGVLLRQRDVFAPIGARMLIAQKTVKHAPLDKRYDGFIASVAGAHGLVEINTRLRRDPGLQRAMGPTACAEQSAVRQTLEPFCGDATRGDSGDEHCDLAGLERRLQAVGRAVLGQVVERVLARRAAREGTERLPWPHCDGPMRRVDLMRKRHIQGVVGDYTIERAYDLSNTCRCGQAPLDVCIGLGPGTLSPTLTRAVCRLGIEASFETAMDATREMLGVTVADETARRNLRHFWC